MVVNTDRVTLPTDMEFNAKVLTTSNWPLFKHTQVLDRSYVGKMMPIPSFLAYDGFDKDVNAVTLTYVYPWKTRRILQRLVC